MKSNLVIVLLVVLVLVSGCAGLQIKEDDIAAELVVKAATAEYLREHPYHADNIASITNTALSAIDSKRIITVDSLDTFVRAKANLDSLAPETQMIVDLLIKRVKASILASLEKNGISEPSKSMIQAKIVVGWVNETARVYAANPN